MRKLTKKGDTYRIENLDLLSKRKFDLQIKIRPCCLCGPFLYEIIRYYH